MPRPSPTALLPSPVLALALLAAGCDAELRPIRDGRGELPPAVSARARPTSGLHGHRDLQGDFDSVWAAAVEALHARGIAVPRGAREESTRGVVDVEGLLLVVVQRAPGRVCLEATLPELDEAAGRAEAGSLFDEVAARLR